VHTPAGSAASLRLAFSATREDGRTGADGPFEGAGTLSDVQLIALARESHAEAFELLYATYKGRLYTFLLRMVGEPELADDVTQDVFTKVYGLLPTLEHGHRVLPWLYRVASNAAIDHLRRRRRFAWFRLGGLAGTREEPRSPDEHARVPEQDHVQTVLRSLPPENAAALLLHALEGYSYKEIGEIQGVTMTAVRSRIARARAAFRDRYDGDSDR
jgi:RNA polymerase sigma-70 factor (ECF subfamily)